jgi:hypothetical protein
MSALPLSGVLIPLGPSEGLRGVRFISLLVHLTSSASIQSYGDGAFRKPTLIKTMMAGKQSRKIAIRTAIMQPHLGSPPLSYITAPQKGQRCCVLRYDNLHLMCHSLGTTCRPHFGHAILSSLAIFIFLYLPCIRPR